MMLAGFQKIEQADDVDRRVVYGVGYGMPHTHLRRMVGSNLWSFVGQNVAQRLAVANIRSVKRRLRVNLRRAAGR